MIPMPPVGDETIRQAMDCRARETPDDIYCTFEGRAWRFAEMDEAVNRLANGLLAQGLRPGDRVALMLPAHPDHMIAILALAKVGLVRVPVNIHLVGAALAYPFEAFAPDAAILDDAYAEALAPVLSAHALRHVVWRGGWRTPSFGALLAHPDASPPPVQPQPDDIIAITPSSGTTGAPKGVLKSDRTLRAGPRGILRLTESGPGDVFLFWEAMHHGAGVAVLIAAILERITLAMVPRFSASRFWADASALGATRVHYLGSVMPMVLKQPPAAEDRAHRVTIAWGGGCPAELWPAIEERFGVEIREGYGLSELITFTTLNLDGPVGSIGRALGYYEAKVFREDGTEAAPGETGELSFRAFDPRLGFLGYFRNPQATAEVTRGEWFLTGDLARRDEEGWLYYAGRRKDSIRRRGINISAWEVERVLLDHPAIEECALVGVPSELGEDEIKVFIRLASGATLGPAELIAWCRPRMPPFHLPRYVCFAQDFPRTPTQRIRKSELPRETAGCWDREAL